MQDSDEGLRREIGFFGSAMLVLNGIVGASIFALPGKLLTEFGAFSPWLIPLFGLLVFLIAIPLSEVASYYEKTGGPVAYTREAFGPFVAFQTGWAYYIARLTAFAANSTVFVAYAASIWPPLGEGAPRAAVIVILTFLITAINIIGVKRAAVVLDAVSVLKAAPLLILALVGVALYGFRGGEAIALPQFSEVERASLLILYAFIGFETSLVIGGETRDAKRTIPRALLASLGATIIFYFIVQFGYASAMAGETPDKAPLVAFGAKLIGPAGAVLMIVAALFSVFGNLMASMASSPRVAFTLARDGELPAWFGAVSSRFATPANSIAFLGAAACILALTGSFAFLAVVSTLARLFVYLGCLGALPVIRKARKAPAREGASRITAPLVLAGGLIFCVWAIFQSTAQSWRLFGALLLVGSALYAFERYVMKPARRATNKDAADTNSP